MGLCPHWAFTASLIQTRKVGVLASSPPDHSGSSARVRLQPSLPLTWGTGRELSPFACRHPSTELFHLQGSSSSDSAVDGGKAWTARPLGSLSKWAASCANYQLCSSLTQIHPAAGNSLQALTPLTATGKSFFSPVFYSKSRWWGFWGPEGRTARTWLPRDGATYASRSHSVSVTPLGRRLIIMTQETSFWILVIQVATTQLSNQGIWPQTVNVCHCTVTISSHFGT